MSQSAAGCNPRFFRIEIDIAELGEFHDHLACAAQVGNGSRPHRRLLRVVGLCPKTAGLARASVGLREFCFAVVVGKDKCAVDEVAVFAEEFVVAARLKIFPGEFRVLAFRGIGGDRIADLIGSKLFEERSQDRYTSLPTC